MEYPLFSSYFKIKHYMPRLDIYAVFFGNNDDMDSIRNNTATFKNQFFEWLYFGEWSTIHLLFDSKISWKIFYDKLSNLRRILRTFWSLLFS